MKNKTAFSNKHLKTFPLIAAGLLMLLAVQSFSAVPYRINYQGRLKQNNIPVNGTTTMVFRLTDSSGGTQYWTSGTVGVTVSSGLFNYVITPTPNFDWVNNTPY